MHMKCFAVPPLTLCGAMSMFLEEDKALKVWPISICVKGIELGLKQPPVYSKLRVSFEIVEGQTC